MRTADGVGAEKVYLSGYSPFPAKEGAPYLTPAQKMIAKTALGAEKSIPWKKNNSLANILSKLKDEGYAVVALEQCEKSLHYGDFSPDSPVALIIGNEPKGIDKRILKKCDHIIEIPMRGKKNSLNVSVAFGIAAYDICSKMK